MIAFERVRLNYDEATDTSVPVTTSIAGQAIQVQGKGNRFGEANQKQRYDVTLLYTPEGYAIRANSDEFVVAGDTVRWAGEQFTVGAVNSTTAPDGYLVCSRVEVAR